MKFLPALDGVRGISILLVVLFHFGLLDMGWMGVEVFFVLSGYLITSILSKGREWPLGFYLKRFYWRRMLRIFPIYFALLGGFVLLYLLVGHPVGVFELLPSLLTYTFNIAMMFIERGQHIAFHYLWSLSLEEQFYLVWPILVFILPRRALAGLCLGLVALSPLIRHLLAVYLTQLHGSPDLVGGTVYYFPLGQFDTFATGALLAVLPWERYIHRPLRVFWGMMAIFITVGLVNLSYIDPDGLSYSLNNLGYPVASMARGQHIWSYTIINFSSAALIMVAVVARKAAGGNLRKLLELRWLMRIGKISYGMYILHWPMQMVYEHFMELQENLLLRFLQFLPFFCLVWLASWLSFRYFESWFLRMKDWKFNQVPRPAKPEELKPFQASKP